MAISFTVTETKMSPLWDFGWFDLTRFAVEGPTRERQECQLVLRQFLRDPISQRSFCDRGPWGEPVQRHGPFLCKKLDVEWFQPTDSKGLAERVDAALSDPSFSKVPSNEQRRPVEEWVDRVKVRGDSAFVLQTPNAPDSRVDWAFVWVVYHEFICLNAEGDELTVAVIGYD